MWQALCGYIESEANEFVEWSKCGDSYVTLIPTVLWAVGTAALTERLLRALFRRFLFRRVPMWELVFQNLLFIWMVIYSLHFWSMFVKLIKVFVDYFYADVSLVHFQQDAQLFNEVDLQSRRMIQQWLIWICSVVPLAVFYQTRPRPEPPPLMIWITANPWLRREMGPYGYYLNRPFSTMPSSTNVLERQQTLTTRKAFSDSNILIKEPPKRRRHSKSV